MGILEKIIPKDKVGILGMGEVGSALAVIYNDEHNKDMFKVLINDHNAKVNTFEKGMRFLHVCIPFSSEFVRIVRRVSMEYQPEYIIIHSTVKMGTTKELFDDLGNVVHSPVRGVHPHLAEGIKTFTKYVGADEQELGQAVCEHLKAIGLTPELFICSEVTELGKLLDTTYYGLCIAFHDYARKIIDGTDGVLFAEAMTEFNRSYNAGYTALGKENVVRPVLYPPEDSKIGGHCIIPNAELLLEQFGEDPILSAILRHK